LRRETGEGVERLFYRSRMETSTKAEFKPRIAKCLTPGGVEKKTKKKTKNTSKKGTAIKEKRERRGEVDCALKQRDIRVPLRVGQQRKRKKKYRE